MYAVDRGGGNAIKDSCTKLDQVHTDPRYPYLTEPSDATGVDAGERFRIRAT
jgi:hypothetical protein